MKKFLRLFLKAADVFVCNALYRVKVVGLENIPKNGKAILAANHGSFLDPVVLFHVIRRKHYSITANFLFKIRWLAWAFKATDCIPAGDSKKSAIDNAVPLLKKGEMVLLFPEGKCRCKKRQLLYRNPKKGVSVLALKTGAPVIPIGIMGTFDAWPASNMFPAFFKKLEVRIGLPLQFERYKSKNPTIPTDLLKANLKIIMSSIKDLLIKD